MKITADTDARTVTLDDGTTTSTYEALDVLAVAHQFNADVVMAARVAMFATNLTDPECWCGETAHHATEVDPVITRASLTVMVNGQPAAPRCDDHAGDTSWPIEAARAATDVDWWAHA